MKLFEKLLVYALLCIVTSTFFVSCDEKDRHRKDNDLYSWGDIVGFYATKPEKDKLAGYDWATYYKAYALKIDENVLTDCGLIEQSDYLVGYVGSYCSELLGDWYSDMLLWQIYGLDINGDSVDVLNYGEPTGYTIDVYDDYVIYKGRTYYKASYFNSHVSSWTLYSDTNTTPSQPENITVSISSRLVSSSSFLRKYEITVSATGSNFSVQQIGIDRVSGTFYPPSPVSTSAHQYTFSASYSSGSSSKIRGMVKTASGTHYSSNTITLN